MNVSVAVSSIMFVTWMIFWLLQAAVSPEKLRMTFSDSGLRLFNIFVLLYILAEILSRLFAVYPEEAFTNFKRVLLFAVFYVSVSKIRTPELMTKLLAALIVFMSLISLAEIGKYAIDFSSQIAKMPFSEIRIDYFNYPLTSAEIKMMALLSVVPFLFRPGFPGGRPRLALICLPVLASMLLTQSRNVYLAFFLALLLYGMIANRRFALSLVAVVAVAILLLPASVTERARSIFDPSHPSNASRLVMWETGLKMFADDPFTGTGDSKFEKVYETYRKPVFHSEGVHLHSNFFMILATSGLPGIISFAGMFFALIIHEARTSRRSVKEINRNLALGSLLMTVSFLIAGMFEWNFGDHEVMTVFFFLASASFIAGRSEDQKEVIELHSS